jgi:hypothetical protein
LSRAFSHLREIRSWRPRRVLALGLGLATVAGACFLLHTSAQSGDALRDVQWVTRVDQIIVNSPSGDVQLLQDRDGLTVRFDFKGQTSQLEAGFLLDGAMVPSGWRATVHAYNLGASGAFTLSFFGDEANLPPRHLSYDQGTLTVQHDNCSSEPLPLELTATPYGVQEFDSTSSNLTLQYKVTLELISDCY